MSSSSKPQKLSNRPISSKAKYSPPKLDGFVFTERLGSGTYATVYKAYKKSSEHREVLAIKCIQKSSLNRAAIENLLVEIEILKQIKHPHIVRMLDFQWDSAYIYIIMEYCAGGDLSHFIATRRMLPEYIVKRFLQQIASALQLLYNHNISHMDLKPQNILLTSADQPVLKLADFGFAQYLDSSMNNVLKGSPLYMAPEIIMQRQYDAKVDLWSIGVILYECLFGRAPFASRSFVELETKIKSEKPVEIPTYPRTSDNCSSLLYGLLQRNPDERMSFDEFFLHPFVDLEHKPSPECITKATSIVTQAVAKDKEGKTEDAIKLYGEAIEYFVPAIYYEPDQKKKEALRTKVKQYCSRAERLKHSQSSPETASDDLDFLWRIADENKEISEPLHMLVLAGKKESEECLDEAMNLYERSLETLIPALAKIKPDPQTHKRLHRLLETHLIRAEAIRERLKKGEVKSDSTPSPPTGHNSQMHQPEDEEDSSKKCAIQ